MIWELVLSRDAFAAFYDGVLHEPTRVSTAPAGLARLPERHFAVVPSAHSPGRREMNAVLAGVASEAEVEGRLLSLMRRPPVPGPTVYAVFGVNNAAGLWRGRVMSDRGIEPVDTLRVIAEGLPVMRSPSDSTVDRPTAAALEMWSRTVGALSPRVWTRLSNLKVALFGCGRSGSLVANALARSGVREIALIDPDLLELHNCGEMDLVTPNDTGRAKAEALAASLDFLSVTRVQDAAAPATAVISLVAAKDAEFLIACVDNPAARLAISVLAQLYLKPLLDIGAGIHASPRRMGADVRLVLPGRCLACFGGLRVQEAAAGMRNPALIESDWRRQRAGSLRSLNMVAAGMALRLLEDFLSGDVRDSTWLRINYDRPVPEVESQTPPAVSGCAVCELAGLGDAGLERIPQFLDLLAQGRKIS
jgi:molybdopterin/thiamine biosynthesis adenylyltransferase